MSAAYSGEASAPSGPDAPPSGSELGGVVAEDEGQQRDGAGLHDAEARPREEEAHAPAEGPRQVLIVSAGAGVGRGHLGVAQRADERDEPAGQPGEEHQPRAAGVLGHEGGRAEDSHTHHRAHGEPDDVAKAQRRPGRRLVRGAGPRQCRARE